MNNILYDKKIYLSYSIVKEPNIFDKTSLIIKNDESFKSILNDFYLSFNLNKYCLTSHRILYFELLNKINENIIIDDKQIFYTRT